MSQPFVGEIKIFGGNFAIAGYAFCDGQLLSISQYDTLFSLIGTTYGGDGQSTFALPDLRGRLPLGQGQGTGLTNRTLGTPVGSEVVTLNANQLPTHTHAAACSTLAGDSSSPAGNFWASNSNAASAQFSATSNAFMNASDTSLTGSSQSHSNLAPFLAVNFLISLQGIYPTQN